MARFSDDWGYRVTTIHERRVLSYLISSDRDKKGSQPGLLQFIHQQACLSYAIELPPERVQDKENNFLGIPSAVPFRPSERAPQHPFVSARHLLITPWPSSPICRPRIIQELRGPINPKSNGQVQSDEPSERRHGHQGRLSANS